MPTIAVVNAKGGVGKTTTAILLAAAGARANYDVRVMDLDPQHSSLDWAAGAEAAGEPFPFVVEAGSAGSLNPSAEDEIIILDTPPILPKVIDAAVDVADYVIVVTTPEPAAVRQAWKILPSVDHRPHAVLIVNATVGTRLLDQTRATFEDEGVPIFPGHIPRREVLKACNGSILPRSLYGYQDVWEIIIGENSEKEY